MSCFRTFVWGLGLGFWLRACGLGFRFSFCTEFGGHVPKV